MVVDHLSKGQSVVLLVHLSKGQSVVLLVEWLLTISVKDKVSYCLWNSC